MKCCKNTNWESIDRINVRTTKTTHISSGAMYDELDKNGKIESYEKKFV